MVGGTCTYIALAYVPVYLYADLLKLFCALNQSYFCPLPHLPLCVELSLDRAVHICVHVHTHTHTEGRRE